MGELSNLAVYSDFFRLRYNTEFRRRQGDGAPTIEQQLRRSHAVSLV